MSKHKAYDSSWKGKGRLLCYFHFFNDFIYMRLFSADFAIIYLDFPYILKLADFIHGYPMRPESKTQISK